MGEEIKILDVQAENWGTLIQVDTDKGRLFVPTRDIFKALNNFLLRKQDAELDKMGFIKTDSNLPIPGMIE